MTAAAPRVSMAVPFSLPVPRCPRVASTASMRRRVRSLLASMVLAATLPVTAPVIAAAGATADIVVRASLDAGRVTIAVECPVHAPREVAWEVLTDYDGMARFVSNLEESVVRLRLGDRLQVFQKGKATRGPLTFPFESLRDIELVPQVEIRSTMVSGDTMPASFATRIEGAAPALRIVHSGTYTPRLWVPPLVGPALIEMETRKQYGEIRDEILRRAAAR
jgi:Polyketide cyclase / dehydrase and lipid transport